MRAAKVAYPESSDANSRDELANKLRELADCYGKIAEAALRRGDRHSVYEAVKAERESLAKADRVERGHVRF